MQLGPSVQLHGPNFNPWWRCTKGGLISSGLGSWLCPLTTWFKLYNILSLGLIGSKPMCIHTLTCMGWLQFTPCFNLGCSVILTLLYIASPQLMAQKPGPHSSRFLPSLPQCNIFERLVVPPTFSNKLFSLDSVCLTSIAATLFDIPDVVVFVSSSLPKQNRPRFWDNFQRHLLLWNSHVYINCTVHYRFQYVLLSIMHECISVGFSCMHRIMIKLLRSSQ